MKKRTIRPADETTASLPDGSRRKLPLRQLVSQLTLACRSANEQRARESLRRHAQVTRLRPPSTDDVRAAEGIVRHL